MSTGQSAPELKAPLVEILGLNVGFAGANADRPIVIDVDLTIRPGECVALVGESGSGKSVSALSVLKLLPYPTASHPSGAIRFRGRDLLTASDQEMREVRGNDISIIFQEPMTSLNPVMRIGDQIIEAVRLHQKVSSKEAWKQAVDMLRLVRIPEPERRAREYPHQLSGGMRQRAMIAMALALDPKLLIADEPTTALDVTTQAQILKLIRDLQQRKKTAVLFITHDLGLAAERAQHIVVMYKGQVVESGPSLEVLQHPQHPYTKRLVAAAPSLASQRIISVKEHGGDATAVMEHAVNEDSLKKGEAIITVDHLTKEFKLPRKKEMFKAVDDVSFSIKKGTTLAIVGESGSGKSTVANMVLKLLEPTAGTVTYDGKDISGFKGKELLDFRRHVQPVFQNPYGSLDPMYSIYRSIEEPLRIHGIGDKKSRAKRVRELIDMVELPESVMSRYPNELSGGQRQAVTLLMATLKKPKLLLLDEPTAALDLRHQERTLRSVRACAEAGACVIVVLHDLNLAAGYADRIVLLEQGRVAADGTPLQVLTEDNLQRVYQQDVVVLEHPRRGVPLVVVT